MKINIVGAGISGLVAAIQLEKAGFKPHIFEASTAAGGRVKTEVDQGIAYDHGFQVLLEAYPLAQKYLDYPALELQAFLPGALVFKDNKRYTFGDPLRHPGFLWPIVSNPLASFSDKIKVFLLSQRLKKTPISDIFKRKEQSTLSYLQEKGFSSKIIEHFFRPFFSGIFLETSLETSSRMFEFVFKMFAEGKASIPKRGIQVISQQLIDQLKQTKIHYNTLVQKVDDKGIYVEGLPLIESDYTIIATQAAQLVSGLKSQETRWKSCHCFYFEVPEKQIKNSIIGLVPGGKLINNLHLVQPIEKSKTNILSVTVVEAKDLSEKALLQEVIEELQTIIGPGEYPLKKHFHIPKALPHLTNIQYEIDASETQLTERIFLAGDLLLNGSLNAAMRSGELAAEAVMSKIDSNM